MVLTPRFQDPGRLVFLLLPEGKSEPILVAKLPRFPGHCGQIEREAQVLHDIQASRPGGFESIPHLVALDVSGDYMILLETAVRGRALDQVTMRRSVRASCEATLAWLAEVQRATRHTPDSAGGWFERLVERPLLDLEAAFPAEAGPIARTRELSLPLSKASLSLVLEHGDLSHPNLLVDRNGQVGVIDWELAEMPGLPAVDLFFFLAYAARALSRAQSSIESVAAVDRAFFGRRSWARTFVRRYAQAMVLSQDMLTPLFVACWARQAAGLTRRTASGEEMSRRTAGGRADWARRDWRFAVWRHAVDRAHQLDWDDLAN